MSKTTWFVEQVHVCTHTHTHSPGEEPLVDTSPVAFALVLLLQHTIHGRGRHLGITRVLLCAHSDATSVTIVVISAPPPLQFNFTLGLMISKANRFRVLCRAGNLSLSLTRWAGVNRDDGTFMHMMSYVAAVNSEKSDATTIYFK